MREYPCRADNPSCTLLPCRSNFSMELESFQKLMNSIKRGDIVGITGFPGKSKRGELSIFPSAMQVGGRAAATHQLAGFGGGDGSLRVV